MGRGDRVPPQNMGLGLVLTKSIIWPDWNLTYDLQPGHFYDGGFMASPNFCLYIKFFKYAAIWFRKHNVNVTGLMIE